MERIQRGTWVNLGRAGHSGVCDRVCGAESHSLALISLLFLVPVPLSLLPLLLFIPSFPLLVMFPPVSISCIFAFPL